MDTIRITKNMADTLKPGRDFAGCGAKAKLGMGLMRSKLKKTALWTAILPLTAAMAWGLVSCGDKPEQTRLNGESWFGKTASEKAQSAIVDKDSVGARNAAEALRNGVDDNNAQGYLAIKIDQDGTAADAVRALSGGKVTCRNAQSYLAIKIDYEGTGSQAAEALASPYPNDDPMINNAQIYLAFKIDKDGTAADAVRALSGGKVTFRDAKRALINKIEYPEK